MGLSFIPVSELGDLSQYNTLPLGNRSALLAALKRFMDDSNVDSIGAKVSAASEYAGLKRAILQACNVPFDQKVEGQKVSDVYGRESHNLDLIAETLTEPYVQKVTRTFRNGQTRTMEITRQKVVFVTIRKREEA